MATSTRSDDGGGIDDQYTNCLITPMTDSFKPAHVIDAVLVAGIVFFAVLLGDSVIPITTGEMAYLSIEDILSRLPTAAIGAALTFFFQAARARGIDVLEKLQELRGGK